jgi:hypothetical protein
MGRIYLDEDVPFEQMYSLKTIGHVVAAARRVFPGGARVPDSKHLDYAVSHDSTVVTHNGADFQLLHDAWRRWTTRWRIAQLHGGIINIPHADHVGVSIGELAQAVHDRLDLGAIDNQMHQWHPRTGWVEIPCQP